MPGNSKPRKRYRGPGSSKAAQRHVRRIAADRLAILLRSNDRSEVSFASKSETLLQFHSALSQIKRGEARDEHANLLAFASNLSLLLAEKGVGKDLLPQIQDAQIHLVHLQGRVARRESIVLTGPGIASVSNLIAILEAQFEVPELTEGLMYECIKDIMESMEIGNAYEVPQ